MIGAGVLESEELGLSRPGAAGPGPEALYTSSSAPALPEIPPADMVDADLVAGTLAGRRECYAELVMRYTDMVATFAYGRTRERELAEEVAQEALVRAYENLWSLKAPRRFSSWLLGIARNVASRALEERARLMTVGSEPLAAAESKDVGGEPLGGLSAEDRKRILAEIEALDEHYRVAFVLRHQMNLPCAEVARRLALPEGTVRSRLSRAYAILRMKLRGLRGENA